MRGKILYFLFFFLHLSISSSFVLSSSCLEIPYDRIRFRKGIQMWGRGVGGERRGFCCRRVEERRKGSGLWKVLGILSFMMHRALWRGLSGREIIAVNARSRYVWECVYISMPRYGIRKLYTYLDLLVWYVSRTPLGQSGRALRCLAEYRVLMKGLRREVHGK